MQQAYHIHKHTDKAWQLFKEMKVNNIPQTSHTYATALSIVGDMKDITEGIRIHQQLMVIKKFNEKS